MRIGLLGGSFNPAHAGHRQLAEIARHRLRLHQVWLLVSPGNPLKRGRDMATAPARLRSAGRIADGRRILASGIESIWGTRYTIDTIRILKRRFPRARFVWLLGADILPQFPRWKCWTGIAGRMPLAVLPRAPYTMPALAGQAAQRLRHARKPARAAPCLVETKPPSWLFLPAPQNPISATALRAAGRGADEGADP